MADSDDRNRGGFSPEAKALFSRADKFHSTTVHPNAARWELHDRASNQGAMREAAKLGFTGIEVDKERGGLGLGVREKLRVAEILGRSSLSFALGLLASQNVAVRLSTSGSARHRSDLLPGLLAGTRFGSISPPDLHSSAASATAARITATKNPSGWVLNGEATWVVSAAVSDVFVCYADTGSANEASELACFVVRSGQVGIKLAPAYRLVAGAPIGIGGFELSDYQCLDTDMLIAPSEAAAVALADVSCQRLEIAVLACTAVRSALGSAVDGSTRDINDDAGLARSANLLEAAEALTASAIDQYCINSSSAATAELAVHAKQFSCGVAEEAIAACLRPLGRDGLLESEATGRLLAECRILGEVAGGTRMLQDRIAGGLDASHSSAASADVTVTAAKQVDTADQAAEPVVDLRDPSSGSLSSWASPGAPPTSTAAAPTSAAAPATSAAAVPPMPPAGNQLASSAPAAERGTDTAEQEDLETESRSLPPMPPPDLRRAGS